MSSCTASPCVRVRSQGISMRRSRVVVVRAADLQRPELKKPTAAPAPSPEPVAAAAAPATAPAPAAAPAFVASSAPDGSAPTIEFQRTRAKAIRAWFQEIKLSKQVMNAQVFGWTSDGEILNGRWVMFGLLVGALTEYATGYSFPDQIALLLSYLGVTDN